MNLAGTAQKGNKSGINIPDTTAFPSTITGTGLDKAFIGIGHQLYTNGGSQTESLPTIESYSINEFGKSKTTLLINPYVNGQVAIGSLYSQWIFNNSLTINDCSSEIKNKILAMAKPGGSPNAAETMYFDISNGINIWGSNGNRFAIGNGAVTVGIGITNPNSAVALDVNGPIQSHSLSGPSDGLISAMPNGIMVRPTGDKLINMIKNPVKQIVKPMEEDIETLREEIKTLKDQMAINTDNQQIAIEAAVTAAIQKLSGTNIVTETPKMYPNPAKEQTTLQLPDGIEATASLVTSKGTKISQSEKFKGTITLPLNNIPPGPYYFILKGIKL